MPEVETYIFSHKELLTLMVKESNIHEGEWTLQVNFMFTAGNVGPSDDNLFPGGIVAVQQLGITKAKEGVPRSLVVNAAEINPRSST